MGSPNLIVAAVVTTTSSTIGFIQCWKGLRQINAGSFQGKETIQLIIIHVWCDYQRVIEGPRCPVEGRAQPICLHFQCQVPKCEHFILIIVPGINFELSDIPLKRGSFLAKKESS